MLSNTIKTIILLLFLTLLLMYAGNAVSQQYGMIFGLLASLAINTFIYLYSDQIVLSMYKAVPLDADRLSWLHSEAKNLSEKMGIPLPRLWTAGVPIANAFAVGKNPQTSSVVFTMQLLDILKPEELKGILAHELAHVKNRDTLIGMIASSMAGAIGYVGYMLRQGALMWRPRDRRENARTPLANLVLMFILPFGATLLRLALSRSREFSADETGAHYSGDPLALASALEKLEQYKRRSLLLQPVENPRYFMTEALFIINPFTSKNPLFSLLSTHPPVEERIRRLKELYKAMQQ